MRQKNQIYSKISQFVTVRGKYNESMRNCLLSASASGAFWLIFLFVACFLGVHTVRLAKIGWKYRKGESAEDKKSLPPSRERESSPRPQAPAEPPLEKQESAPPRSGSAPEPVYYIVERKRRRSRDSYSPPKEIKFK
jgi:hypothetical protein